MHMTLRKISFHHATTINNWEKTIETKKRAWDWVVTVNIGVKSGRHFWTISVSLGLTCSFIFAGSCCYSLRNPCFCFDGGPLFNLKKNRSYNTHIFVIYDILRQRFYGDRMSAAGVLYLGQQSNEKIARVAVVMKSYITVTVLLEIRDLPDSFFFWWEIKFSGSCCNRELQCGPQHWISFNLKGVRALDPSAAEIKAEISTGFRWGSLESLGTRHASTNKKDDSVIASMTVPIYYSTFIRKIG